MFNRDESTERELSDLAAPRSGTPPPDYTPCTVGPPVYMDALQDVIIQTGLITTPTNADTK